MSEAKHTPGPWRIGRNYGAVVADHPVPELRGSDDVNAYGGHLIAESIALQNRPLIAAAPDLLEALKCCKDALYFVMEQAGGPECEHEGNVCFCTEKNAIFLAVEAINKAEGNE